MLDMLNSSDDEKRKRECENLKLKLNELEKEKDQEMIFLKEENSGLKNEKSKLYDDMNKTIFDFEIEKENLLKWKNENVRLFEEMNKRTNEIENEKEFYKKQIEMQHQNNSFMDQTLKEKTNQLFEISGEFEKVKSQANLFLQENQTLKSKFSEEKELFKKKNAEEIKISNEKALIEIESEKKEKNGIGTTKQENVE